MAFATRVLLSAAVASVSVQLASADAPFSLLTGCSSACCNASLAFQANLNSVAACALLPFERLTNFSQLSDANGYRYLGGLVCHLDCYAQALATLKSSVSGLTGTGCGIARAWVAMGSTMCARDALGRSCTAAAADQLAQVGLGALPRAARLALEEADRGNLTALNNACGADACANATLSALGYGVSSGVMHELRQGNWGRAVTVSGVGSPLQAADLAADVTLGSIALTLPALSARRCAKDAGTGAFCSVLLGDDFVVADASAAAGAPWAFLSSYASAASMCSFCGLTALRDVADRSRAMMALAAALGPANATGWATLWTYQPAVAARLALDVTAASVYAALLPALTPLCGNHGDGSTCLAHVADIDLSHADALQLMENMEYCIPLFAPNSGSCASAAPGCGAALGAIQARYGCCFSPLMTYMLVNPANAGLLPEITAFLNGSTLNSATITTIGAECGADLAPCAGSKVVRLSFRLTNVLFSAMNATGALRAAFLSALGADLAALLNVDVTAVTVVSIAPPAGNASGVDVVVAVRACSDTASTAASSGALASFNAGTAQFSGVNSLVVGNPSLAADATQPVTTDPTVGAQATTSATPTPSPSGASASSALSRAAALLALGALTLLAAGM